MTTSPPKPLPPSARKIAHMLSDGPMHRHDIGRSFTSRPMWPQTATMLCGRLIKPLIERGWVREIGQPFHHAYELTPAGRAALREMEDEG